MIVELILGPGREGESKVISINRKFYIFPARFVVYKLCREILAFALAGVYDSMQGK